MYTYADQFVESPLVNSYDDTKPRRTHASFHGHNILNHSSSPSFQPSEGALEIGHKEKHGKKNKSFACRIREHVKLGPKLSETVKGKLQLGAKIIQGGGRENIFRQVFEIREGEQMLKASQCYLSTTDGPIAGLLFISTEKVAFCSEKSITVPSRQFTTTPIFKVVIPVSKIQMASRSGNEENTAQKYIEIVTEDNFEYRFMGFLRYEKAFHNLQMAIRRATRS
ncbi:GEM-like protein 7 isoform X2 [Juglans microcarpa x Juglans regia]|uniref:GEM-like protein 7 isoform X2 n=1 Tax=Juglans microcarpa x Juglans regia TaxID=2249226 RepID=UPI001B7F5D29|nr:GEM-like protein 7 isoform X2 [Juglans microcarpa x Juglans regia]